MNESNGARFGFIAWLPVLVAALIVIGLIVGVPAEENGELTRLVREDGPVETITALGYVLCAALLVGIWLGGVPLTVSPVSACLVLLAMGAREMDLHHTPWTMSISKIHFYTSPDVPLPEKVIAVAILAVILWSFLQLALSGLRSLILGLKRANPVSWAVLIAASLAVLSKMSDGLGRNLRSLGITVGTDIRLEFNKIEELLELGIPLFVMASLLSFLIASRPRREKLHA